MGKSQRGVVLSNGTSVGHRLVIHGHLGSGTFAQVYRCKKGSNPKEYALKIVDKEDLGPHEIAILKLISDNQSESFYCMKLLQHFTYKQTFSCLVMPSYGPSLYDLLYSNVSGLPMMRIKDLALGIFAGLEFLHRFDIIHTDIKPENIVVRRSGDFRHPIIVDFGSAVFESTTNTELVTTVAYRAPEVEINNPIYNSTKILVWDSAIDIWSAGCVLYELWKREQLFDQDPELSLMYHIQDIVGGLPFPLPKRHKEVFLTMRLKELECNDEHEAVLKDIIRQCLNPLSGHRPNASEVLRILRSWDM